MPRLIEKWRASRTSAQSGEAHRGRLLEVDRNAAAGGVLDGIEPFNTILERVAGRGCRLKQVGVIYGVTTLVCGDTNATTDISIIFFRNAL